MIEIPEQDMPPAVRALPRDEHGYPVPFFVAVVNGKPDLRVADGEKKFRVARYDLCWVCGQKNYRTSKAFTGGPLSVLNRLNSEGPCHLECARFAMRFCPFLNNQASRRRKANLPEEAGPVLGLIQQKPPAMAILLTPGYRVEYVDGTRTNFVFVPAKFQVEWWHAGERLDWGVAIGRCREWCEQMALEMVDEPHQRVRALNTWRGRLGLLKPIPAGR